MLLGRLDASLLGNILTWRGAIAKRQGRGIYRAGKGHEINRAGEGIEELVIVVVIWTPL